MRLGEQSFLLLHTDVKSLKRRIEIAPNFTAALETWTAGTRVSPIWGVEEFGTSRALPDKFPGKSILIFFGPVAPARLIADVAAANDPSSMNVWVTFGCFNLFTRLDATNQGRQAGRELLAWANSEKIPYEKWSVENGYVRKATPSSPAATDSHDLVKELLALSKVGDEIPAIRMTLQEYCALMASAATRSSIILPGLYLEVRQVAERIKQVFDKYKEKNLTQLKCIQCSSA